jgi:hypothetical protein
MQGIIRASTRLLVMALVMAAVLVLAVYAGLAATTAIALGVLASGIAGILIVSRNRAAQPSAADEIAAMMAPARPAAAPAVSAEVATAVDAMAPPIAREVDPEANMPRWRRPSLLEARRSDPSRQAASYRIPMRFTDDQIYQFDVRRVRYAVVPLLDRPDEVLGMRLSDLASGDEVQVLGAQGTFLEVHCPNGDRGWVHRTTLAQPEAAAPAPAFAAAESHDERISSLLSAQGFNQA